MVEGRHSTAGRASTSGADTHVHLRFATSRMTLDREGTATLVREGVARETSSRVRIPNRTRSLLSQ